MRIGIVLRRLHTHGGTERRTQALITGLKEAGHDIHLFAEEWDRSLCEGIRCHRIHTIKASRWMKMATFAALAARATRKLRLDLVHSQAHTYADDLATLGGGCHADYLDYFLADASPEQQKRERNSLFNRVVMALERVQFQRCSRLVLNSHLAKQGLVKYFPQYEEKCRVIHNGVDADFFQPDSDLREQLRAKMTVQENTVLFLYVGNGFERKGLGEFMQAFALMRKAQPERSALAVVVGKGEMPRYRALAKELSIEENIVFTGETSDTRPYYCAADVFVLPTRFDPFANTTNEAMASGLPVITTRTNGACEVITEKEGFLVDRATDVQLIADAMVQLLNDDRRRDMSAAARQNALRRPWEETTRKTLAVYDEIMKMKATQ